MSPADLITSKDGSLSLTKLAASTFHLLLAIGVIAHTAAHEFTFDVTVWSVYGAFAVGHAGYDKTMAVVRDFQEKKLEKATP